jgi:hypothetical protein
VRLASRGRREIDGRSQPIEDVGTRDALRRRAAVLIAQSITIAAAVGVAVWLVARLAQA